MTAPQGVAVVVWRHGSSGREFLVLRRAHPDARGDWEWTPPSGCRERGESVAACARRELAEETGLALEPLPTGCGRPDWPVWVAEAGAGAEVRLDAEHDRCEWVTLAEAQRRCRPAFVGDGFRCVEAALRSGADG